VGKSLVTRHTDPDDRRRVTLVVTPAGRVILETAHAAGQKFLAETMATLDEAERVAVIGGMRALRRAFAGTTS
jgi:DNA-binding MarR family transcriptional regulator